MQDLLVDMKYVVHEPLIVRVDPLVCVSHLQSPDNSQLSCGQLSPRLLVLHQDSLHPFQLVRYHLKSVDLRLE